MFQNDLKTAINEILLGHPVGLPTETVYGLAARIDKPQAVESIFKLKARPFFDPLIVHVGSLEQARSLVSWWPEEAQFLAQHAWPGPLTMVLPKASHIDPMITSGLETVALRWPKHELFQKVLDEVKVPLAAPSANKFGRTSPTEAQHVRSEFKDDPVFVLDGGPCEVGIESTVIKITKTGLSHEISILRKGFVKEADLKSLLSRFKVEFVSAEPLRESPGQMKHHYMPAVPFVVCKKKKDPASLANEIFAKISALPDVVEHVKMTRLTRVPKKISELKLSHEPQLATREFYSQLRKLAENGCECIVYFRENPSPEMKESWAALYDRMDKAASLILND